jgi:hypothetical protein
MKRIFATILFLALLAMPVAVYARPHRIGDMGFHGGITEGRHLPRTLETIIREQGNSRNTRSNRNNAIVLDYAEYIFIGNEPILFRGPLEIRRPASPTSEETTGTYRVEHRVTTPQAAAGAPAPMPTITRTMIFNVEHHLEGSQMIYTYTIDRSNANNWTDVIVTPEGTFTLNARRSTFVVSIWEDRTPAINFYRGDISARLVYTGGPNGDTIVIKTGEFYGVATAWSATETHVTNVSVTNDAWAMQYQIRPSVTVNKELQFVQNTPTQISFEGNFRELHQATAGLRYDILTKPNSMWHVPNSGQTSINVENIFEQLPAQDMSMLRGHPAEDDIHRLFAMQILTGDPRFFVPNQAMTRGQFLTALARTVKLPVEEVVLPRATRGQQPVALTLFSDVNSDRPEFRYIQAIQRAGIAFGRADGKFYFDYPISRQEAIVTIVRALGLSNMAQNPSVVSPFLDSDDIADWAMRHVNVALMLDLIAPDANGNLNPRRAMSKGESAALLNHLLNYMRNGIVDHYSGQLVNITQP